MNDFQFIMDTQESPQESRQNGRWSKEQHQRFMYAIMQYGKDWKKVEQYVRTRTGSQVRSHAQKFFNKLQKATNPSHGQQGEHPQTELDWEREGNSEVTPSTPLELVSLIKKQEKEEGGKINLFRLRKTLDEQGNSEQQGRSQEKPPKETLLPQSSSFKSMSNILSAYEEVNNGKDSPHQDESFFISITKKYKRLFKQVEDFDRLIDLQAATEQSHPQRSLRKRSFTLPQGQELSEEEMDGRIEEIKKRINPEGNREEERQQRRERKEKKERKESDSSIQFMPPPLGRLTTIQEHPQEEEQVSFRAFPQQEKQQGDNQQDKGKNETSSNQDQP